MRKRLFADDHIDVAASLSSVAVSCEKLGRHMQALSFHLSALKMRENLYGDCHCDVAASLSSVGVMHSKLGNHEEAQECFCRGLQIH